MSRASANAPRGRWLTRLRKQQRGSTAVEFAMVAPMFLTMLLGAFEMSFELYMRATLEGAMSKAARDITLESAGNDAVRSALDQTVKGAMQQVLKNTTVTFERKAYANYSNIDSPAEPFDDNNLNGNCDKGESFQDMNGNNTFDKDSSISGWGGAEDAVSYTATASYPRMFPIAGLIGISNTVKFSTTKMLRIQPFTNRRAIAIGTCK
jgi:Flp pilus assembly protein TadG